MQSGNNSLPVIEISRVRRNAQQCYYISSAVHRERSSATLHQHWPNRHIAKRFAGGRNDNPACTNVPPESISVMHGAVSRADAYHKYFWNLYNIFLVFSSIAGFTQERKREREGKKAFIKRIL
jgi:hypothetical protein